MNKHRNWWWEGWKYEKYQNNSGKERHKWIYTGEYYCSALEGKQFRFWKIKLWILAILSLAVYLLHSLLLFPDFLRIIIAPCMLAIIPWLYQFIGLFSLCAVSSKMNYRSYRGSLVRIRWTSIALSVLFAISWLGGGTQMVFIRQFGLINLLWVLSNLFCCFMQACIVYLEWKYRPHMEAQ